MNVILQDGITVATHRTFNAALMRAARLLNGGSGAVRVKSPHRWYEVRRSETRPDHPHFLRVRGGFVVAVPTQEAHQDPGGA